MSQQQSEAIMSLLYRNSDSLLIVGQILKGMAAIAATTGPLDQSTLEDCIMAHRKRVHQVATAFQKIAKNGSSMHRMDTL